MNAKQLRQEKNPYRDNVQGKANEPVTVTTLLDAAVRESDIPNLVYSQREVVRRLDRGAPRIAIIGGSQDHPAHIVDPQTMQRAAASLWRRGAVPFSFGIPVLCDGTAQSNLGMCYSLQSRNLVAAMVLNQMEAHSYHGAFVIQGCDKTPFAVCAGLAHLDAVRRHRGEAPVAASFAPAHVLPGGTIPEPLADELRGVAKRARSMNRAEIGDEIESVMQNILQCASNQAFQGVLIRAREARILNARKHKSIELELAAHTCHPDGGICAFNGTGNSSRLAMSALGLVHPALELLPEPPSFEAVDKACRTLLDILDRDDASVSVLVRHGFANAVRVHAASGGSTNLMMHLSATRTYAGQRTSVHDITRIRREHAIPDLLDYSLTHGRDIFAWAEQVQRGDSMGVASLIYELKRHGVPVDTDAMTVTGTTWAKRLGRGRRASATRVKTNRIIPTEPLGYESGIEVLRGNLFETAVVKIAGMPTAQLDAFDNVAAAVWYFQDEDEATRALLTEDPLESLTRCKGLTLEDLRVIEKFHLGPKKQPKIQLEKRGKRAILQAMADAGTLRIALVIAGQGPKAYGMPEMFTPMHHINNSTLLRRMAMLLSDGRYSGVTYGAAVGHITPEAFERGSIAALRTGDLLWMRLRKGRIDLLDREAWREGRRKAAPLSWSKEPERTRLKEGRYRHILQRRDNIAPANRMDDVTDAARGVVPGSVWDAAC